MSTLAPESLVTQLNWRYAVKKFDSTQKLSTTQWSALEDALVLTASSFGLQPWKFLVVTNPEVKQKLVPVSWGQTQIADCSHLIVFTALKHATEAHVQAYLQDIATTRGITVESLSALGGMLSRFRSGAEQQGTLKDWAIRQVYIALGNLLTSAAVIGVDACPMEGIEPEKYDEILGLSGTDYATALVCPLGFRAADDKYIHYKKVRFPKSQVIQYV
jgi:nitroreductase